MTTIKSKSGKKAVRVSNNNGTFNASHYQIDLSNEREQVIQMKSFSTEKRAITWANKVLA